MPLASAPTGFAYDEIGDASASTQPFARGLIEGTLSMLVASATSP